MRPLQSNLTELLVAVVFVGIFSGFAVTTWGGFFFIQGLVIAAMFLVMTYLVLLLMMRRHRSQ